jgi:UDP-N-acetyl-D-mannosaminuronate dehydrogenase
VRSLVRLQLIKFLYEFTRQTNCSIGLCYVGLPLAIEFGKKYKVLGFDINQSRIEELNLLTDRTKEADLVRMKNAMELAKSNPGLGLNFLLISMT